MKRFLHLILFAVLAASCVKGTTELKLSTDTLDVAVEGGRRMLSVTCDGAWMLSISEDATWCTTDVVSGKGNGYVTVLIEKNDNEDSRTAQITFSAEGLAHSVVTINQKGTASSSVVNPEDPADLVSPDPASGITVDPAYPNADEPCLIKFNPQSGNPLYNHSGELYGHLGVVVEGEWTFVPTDWGTTDKKTHFTKVGDNSWELELTPSIREYFGSGETPVKMIAIIVRSADGSIKSHDADQFCSVKEEKYFEESFTPDPLVFETMPAGVQHGINYNSDNSVTFVLYDKDKDGKRGDYCYIVGDWNGWERVKEGAMKRDSEAGCWWITLSGFEADKEYRFQYRLGNLPSSDIRLSDPYTEIVYDQWNDQYIKGVPAFPEGAKQLVSAFQINKPAYNWQHKDFKVEDKNDLVIYEMLFRDFTKSQNIAGAMAELDYIENLGVTAVQLMPIQEFDGNNSWGYNPNHWFALDKYYGTRDEYKAFIDECHRRGLAVIVDVVYNHATGSHPWAKMYWNGDRTAANNPWFNEYPTHPYNVYHDMNHENAMVKEHVKRSLEYLLTEYDVDGFRFDLTKGFTQKQTDPDVTAWGRYDQSRVDILKGYADHIWSVNDNAVVIFEHLSDWDEEETLANHGMQLWRNVNHEYRSAVTGGSGNFSNMYSTKPFGGYVGYMESHDEERLCYGVGGDASSVTWGVIGLGEDWNNDKVMSADGAFFSVKNVTVAANDRFKIRKAGERPADPSVTPGDQEDALTVAMRRAGASAAFFLTVPGPKMIWQFGEIGYDYTIEHNGRTGEKPVVTDEYMAVPARKALYDTYAHLLKFRRENPRFFDSDAKFEWTPSSSLKTIKCTVDGKTFRVVGNFGKTSATYTFPAESTWYDYFEGGEISGTVTLKQGEFKLVTDFQ